MKKKKSKYLMRYTFLNQLSENNWEISDIIDKFILWEKGVNVLIPKVQYNKNYTYTHRYNWFGSIQ